MCDGLEGGGSNRVLDGVSAWTATAGNIYLIGTYINVLIHTDTPDTHTQLQIKMTSIIWNTVYRYR